MQLASNRKPHLFVSAFPSWKAFQQLVQKLLKALKLLQAVPCSLHLPTLKHAGRFFAFFMMSCSDADGFSIVIIVAPSFSVIVNIYISPYALKHLLRSMVKRLVFPAFPIVTRSVYRSRNKRIARATEAFE